MNFELTDEQQALQDSLKRWLEKNYSFTQRREVLTSPSGFSDGAWRTFAEMGLLALPLPEAHGGLGGRWFDVGCVMQCLGASLVLEPYLPTMLGASLLGALGSAAQQTRWLPGVAEGRTRLALAHAEPGTRHARTRVATSARRDGAAWVLDGHKAVVVGAPHAQALLVSARTAGDVGDATGISVFLVDPKAAGVTLRPYRNHDGQRAADVTLKGVRLDDAALLGTAGGAAAALGHALDRGAAAVCAEAVGIAQAMCDTTLEYLKTRKQFGVTIGSFQALQHRMADMVVAQGQAASMALLATVKVDDPDAAERERAVTAAKAYIGQQVRFIGQQSIQLHGGMGITDEMMVSHLFRRTTLIESSFGDTDHHFERFSRTLLAA